MLRKAGNRDLLPYLEAHLEVFGNLGQIVSELLLRRRGQATKALRKVACLLFLSFQDLTSLLNGILGEGVE